MLPPNIMKRTPYNAESSHKYCNACHKVASKVAPLITVILTVDAERTLFNLHVLHDSLNLPFHLLLEDDVSGIVLILS